MKRRTFLKSSAAAASGSLVAGSLMAGCLETIVEATIDEKQAAQKEEWVPTTCWIGKQDCGILARRVGGRVVKLEGHPANPVNHGTLCPKGIAQIMAMYDTNRVKAPLIRTNEKGVPGEFRRASWEEALTLVAGKVKETRARDPHAVIWQKGRSKAKAFYDDAFAGATGATKLHHGAYCSDAGYRACEYTVGLHGVLHPDFRHCRYLLSWGWNITNAGGNKLCYLTWPRQLVDARERGLKVVAIDPRLRGAGRFADEWLPIKPGTDLALAMALCHQLVKQGTIDQDYLKSFTNAPYLVKDDGTFLRMAGSEMVWDAATGAAVVRAEARDPVLSGEFTVDGQPVRPAFEVFTKHIATYTPEWAETVCGIPAATIAHVAKELGENAMIGNKMLVEGLSLPYRPVAIMAYHMTQQELGFQAVRAMLTVMMLLGAVEAVGGQRVDFSWKPNDNYDKLDQATVKDGPYNIYLKESKFFPINSNNSGIVAKAMLDPAKYGVKSIPEVCILHMTNPLIAYPSRKDIMEAYSKLKFVVAIDPWLSETADYFADVVLPAATMEKYEGPISATDQYVDAVTLRVPPMAPLYESRGDIDIYLDLCEKIGVLLGPDGYLALLNKSLKLKEPYLLPLDKKPEVRAIFDAWAKSQGIEEGVAFFERNGVKVKGPVPASKFYGIAQNPPFDGRIQRLYGESLLRIQQEMKAKGADEIYWRDYTPLPTWRPLTLDASPADYDLYLVSFKLIEFKQSRSAFIPILNELAPDQCLEINPKAASSRGIEDGDEVWVESHNAITGETRKLKVVASYRESIRPDTVGMAHHYGMWVHPRAKGMGASPNELFFTGEGYVTNTADQSFHVKVRVYKA
ncbi:MAG: molybdopterin-dependent oxidoreductase [Candidatus Schekmanbacteria bacterium]|nr:molybdopterin-dependent oxidoreductase [Candidatus Schekmanbacteria bacterium]